MDRMACIDLPAFPLQLVLQRRPEWKDHPVAVVDHDRPQGKILWINERARAFRILPGMRYAAGLSLAAGLRAAAGTFASSASRAHGHNASTTPPPIWKKTTSSWLAGDAVKPSAS